MTIYFAISGLQVYDSAQRELTVHLRIAEGKERTAVLFSPVYYLCVTTGTQLGALSVGEEPKIPGIISDEQSKIRPFSVVAR